MEQHGLGRYAQAFKALGDSRRLKIVELLAAHGELCVCKLEEALGLSQSLVSYHLACLVKGGLISGRSVGTWSYYRLNEEAMDELLSESLLEHIKGR